MKWAVQTLIALLIPSVDAALLFPISKEEATELCIFNRNYYWHLRSLQDLYASDQTIRTAIEETDKLYRVWDYLRDAKTPIYGDDLRRTSLYRLREKIGVEAFSRGEMPPHVPLWRFSEVRP